MGARCGGVVGGLATAVAIRLLFPDIAAGEGSPPAGPPPGFGARDLRWTLEGASPESEEGLVYEATLPILGPGAAPRTLLLRATRPAASPIERPMAVYPSRDPELCLEVPAWAPRTSPVRITWSASDPDRHDKLSLTVSMAQGRIENLAGREGSATAAEAGASRFAEIKAEGRRALEGGAVVAWAEPGEYPITATLSDGVNEVVQQYRIRIDKSEPPRITVLGIPGAEDGAPFAVGDTVRVLYEARDPDLDEALDFVLHLPEGLERIAFRECEGESATGRRCEALIRGTREGRYGVRVDVFDRSRQSDTQKVEIGIGTSPAAACGRIDCDCENVSFGLLTGAFRDECRNHEAELRRQCAESGRVDGNCNDTPSGPNAFPR